MSKYVFGVDVGGTTVKMGLFTVEGEVLDKWEIKTRTEDGGKNGHIILCSYVMNQFINYQGGFRVQAGHSNYEFISAKIKNQTNTKYGIAYYRSNKTIRNTSQLSYGGF